MQLDRSVAQRFQSSVARLTPRFDRVALGFFERLGRDCPQMRRVVPAWTKRGRFGMAAGFAEIVKHINHPGECPAWMGEAFAAAGATEQDLRIMQKALLHEVKAAAGTDWNGQMESDWAAVLRFVFSQMCVSEELPLRKAA